MARVFDNLRLHEVISAITLLYQTRKPAETAAIITFSGFSVVFVIHV